MAINIGKFPAMAAQLHQLEVCGGKINKKKKIL